MSFYDSATVRNTCSGAFAWKTSSAGHGTPMTGRRGIVSRSTSLIRTSKFRLSSSIVPERYQHYCQAHSDSNSPVRLQITPFHSNASTSTPKISSEPYYASLVTLRFFSSLILLAGASCAVWLARQPDSLCLLLAVALLYLIAWGLTSLLEALSPTTYSATCVVRFWPSPLDPGPTSIRPRADAVWSPFFDERSLALSNRSLLLRLELWRATLHSPPATGPCFAQRQTQTCFSARSGSPNAETSSPSPIASCLNFNPPPNCQPMPPTLPMPLPRLSARSEAGFPKPAASQQPRSCARPSPPPSPTESQTCSSRASQKAGATSVSSCLAPPSAAWASSSRRSVVNASPKLSQPHQ